MSHSIVASIITKVFNDKKSFVAVKDLSFSLVPGESVAFLGPNGAGKSTTIKILCGILNPTAGEAFINGHKAGTLEANKQLGLVFGTRSQLYMHMTVYQCLDLIGEIYFLKGEYKKKRISELASLFEIENLLEKRVRTLSLGQRMRCEVIAALIHKPKVLLADEPTIGLDIIAKNSLRELILRWQREEKSTLLLTSHDLSDVEALCDRCILIDHGIKKFDGPLASLKGDLKDLRRINITVSEHTTPSYQVSTTLLNLGGNENFIHQYELNTKKIPMSEALATLSSHYGDKLQDINISEVSLEEVLANQYQAQRSV
ncbi:MAG: ATP-binding cassette domain-containing protein [Bdellovibrionales bacterium]|nr:ATP-binding cassette domain-containing protein [Bdellovibrionales bacterium]